MHSSLFLPSESWGGWKHETRNCILQNFGHFNIKMQIHSVNAVFVHTDHCMQHICSWKLENHSCLTNSTELWWIYAFSLWIESPCMGQYVYHMSIQSPGPIQLFPFVPWDMVGWPFIWAIYVCLVIFVWGLCVIIGQLLGLYCSYPKFCNGCWVIIVICHLGQVCSYGCSSVNGGWVGLWGFLWWAPSAKRKDLHGVSSGWSSVWHRSNTGLSSTQYEQIPIILGVWPFWLTPFFFRSISFWRAYG